MGMTQIDQFSSRNRRAESGVTLAIMLVLTIGFAVIIAIVTDAQQRSDRAKRAESVSWQVTQIAKAARLYVRNNSLEHIMRDTAPLDGIPDTLCDSACMDASPATSDTNNDGIVDNFFKKAELDPAGPLGPAAITVAELIAAGYLPQSFSRVDAQGNNMTEQTILGHPIRIYAANAPVDGDPNLDSTVATAYVVLEDSPNTDVSQALAIARGVQQEGLLVNAPLFSGAANISDNCGASPAVGLWDTGCMDDDDYDLLTGNPAGTGTFSAGTYIFPAWKAFAHDERAIMRFPQPENDSYATMLTNLRMANAVNPSCDGTDPDDSIMITQDDGSTVFSGLCKSISDDSTASFDSRKDIYNVVSFTADRIIAADQRDRGTVGNNYRDMRVVLDGSAAGVVTLAETYGSEEGTLNLETGSDGGANDHRDYDDVMVLGGSLQVAGNTRVFNDGTFSYTNNNIQEAYFTNGITVERDIQVANEAGVNANASFGLLAADKADLLLQTLTASSAEINVGIDQGRNVASSGVLSADAAKAEDETELNLASLTVNGGLLVNPGVIDGYVSSPGSDGLDLIGLTANVINANNADFTADSANLLGTVKTRSLTIANQGSGLFAPVAIDPNISSIMASFVNSGGDLFTVNGDLQVDDFARVEGLAHYRGVTNITSGDPGNPAICTGGINQCPSLEEEPDTPF